MELKNKERKLKTFLVVASPPNTIKIAITSPANGTPVDSILMIPYYTFTTCPASAALNNKLGFTPYSVVLTMIIIPVVFGYNCEYLILESKIIRFIENFKAESKSIIIIPIFYLEKTTYYLKIIKLKFLII